MGLGFASFIGVPARQFALGSHRRNFPAVLDQVFLNTGGAIRSLIAQSTRPFSVLTWH